MRSRQRRTQTHGFHIAMPTEMEQTETESFASDVHSHAATGCRAQYGPLHGLYRSLGLLRSGPRSLGASPGRLEASLFRCTHICMLHVCNCLPCEYLCVCVCVCKCVNAFALASSSTFSFSSQTTPHSVGFGVKFAVSNKPVRILKVTRFWYLLMHLFHVWQNDAAHSEREWGRE